MNRTKKTLIRSNSWLTLLLVAGVVFTAAFACESGGDTVPPEAELQTLAKETTKDFANAIDTESFANLHGKASTDFQSTYTVEQAKTAFKVFIDRKDEVLPSLENAATTTATFTTPPSIRTEKGLNILVMKGSFKAKPNEVKFEYEYVWRSGGWKMLKLVVNM